MTEQDLIEKLSRDISNDPAVPIDASTDLVMSGLIDSIGFMTLIQWIEDECSVAIEPSDMVIDNFETTTHVLALVSRLTSSEE